MTGLSAEFTISCIQPVITIEIFLLKKPDNLIIKLAQSHDESSRLFPYMWTLCSRDFIQNSFFL